MKKIVAIVSSLVLVLAMGIMLAACSSNPVGTYKFDSMSVTINGETKDLKVGDELYPGSKLTEDYMVYELKEDNTYTVSVGGNETMTGKWEQDGSTIKFKAGDTEVGSAKLSGNKLTIEQKDGPMPGKVVLKK